MTWGVPQGSILAPLLFGLYMLALKSNNEKEPNLTNSYADDTQIT